MTTQGVAEEPVYSSFTGRGEYRSCATCGRFLFHEELIRGDAAFWLPRRHHASCGAPCADARFVYEGRDISMWHRRDGCGLCGGETP